MTFCDGLANGLREDVPGRASGIEVVLLVEGITQLRNFEFCRGRPNIKALGGLIQRRARVQWIQNQANMTISALMISPELKIFGVP